MKQEVWAVKVELGLLEEKVNALQLRERIAICVTLVLLILGVFDLVWHAPNSKELAQIKTKHQEDIRLINEYKNQLFQLEEALSKDPDLKLTKEIEAAENEARTLDQVLAESRGGLISPERMLLVLGELLSKESGLKLIEMKNQIPKQVSGTNQSDQIALYRHSLELVFEGSFSAVRKYVTKIESMAEKVYLDEISYHLTDYPAGELRLKVHTLSVYEALISG